MKAVAVIILFVILIALANEIYFFWQRNQKAVAEYQSLEPKFQKVKIDYEHFQSELNYYLNPANLEKELRARFNYRQPGEKLIIIVPPLSSSTNP